MFFGRPPALPPPTDFPTLFLTLKTQTLLNSPNWRGIHQLHIHVAKFKPAGTATLPAALVEYLEYSSDFSVDPTDPTRLTAGSAEPPAVVTVFAPGALKGGGVIKEADGVDKAAAKEEEGTVDPFRLASIVAVAVSGERGGGYSKHAG